MNNILKTDPFCMSHTNLPTREWVVEANASKNFIECFKSNNEEATSGFYGLDSKGSRDWNEEFQVCKDLPKDNVFQRIQRDRAFYKIYYDFIEAARKGAVAIANKSIPALNPMDEELQHVFVYNQIFFSFAIDNKESFKDVSSTDSNPSFTATNHDVLGLRSLQVIDIDGLHIIATCHVNYKGYRVIAQSIIPGILTNTDQSSLTEYGSVDDGKTIYTNEEFFELMKELCTHLSIKECSIVDGEGKEHQIYGSIDIKGIRGTDKRKYLLDLVRLTPRDANYLGKNYTSCLIRPELVRIYQKTKDLEYASEKLKQFDSENPEEEKKQTLGEKNFQDMTEEEKKEAIQERNKENEEIKKKRIERLTKFDQYLKEAPQFNYNLNVFTNANLAPGDYKEDEKAIRNLSNFINENVIPKVNKIFESGENVPTDSESLTSFMHSQGLNVRYLGKLVSSIEDGKLPHIRTLIERCIVCR
jgi:protein TIF31